MAKNQIVELNKAIAVSGKKLAKLKKAEVTARKTWTREYRRFLKAAEGLANLKKRKTKKRGTLVNIVKDWREKSFALTKARDEARQSMAEEERNFHMLETKRQIFIARHEERVKADDELVKQTFALSCAVARALDERNSYLNSRVFPKLVGKEGNLKSQITIDSSDGLRRVVAMVNAISRIDVDLAARAKEKIEEFFSRFQEQVKMDSVAQMFYELTRKILVEKTSFQIGPDLYRFLSLDIDQQSFPGLKEAQELLINGLRSEKSSSYVRLYEREGRNNPWKRLNVGG
ncbi:MAG: hypothetical protein PHC85_01925 [Candidatus Pacebacteria bacterium]|nr:hypothetical protein [Candidatus Paceibacterota bacterium]